MCPYVFDYSPTSSCLLFLFFNVPAPTEIYTLSLHDALPIYLELVRAAGGGDHARAQRLADLHRRDADPAGRDRKSTRLNSSHLGISYAVFCLKKKKKKRTNNLLILTT